MQQIKLIECPRDAMQGWKTFIPTAVKIAYINQLLKVGFDTIDFGSFVSHRAIPQMADTADVVRQLDISKTKTKLLAIVANVRGAEDASAFAQIFYLGYPFSISPTFQHRNANSSIEESLENVKKIKHICDETSKRLVVYISMAFGNPYGDEHSEALVVGWVQQLVDAGIDIISLADTVGLATPPRVSRLVEKVIKQFPNIETGVHLHSTAVNWKDKIDAALKSGCYRFDGALKGFGGCPMAEDKLVGNMNSEWMISYFESLGLLSGLDDDALKTAAAMATEVFS